MTPIILPKPNANDTGARLVEWLVQTGVEVRERQPVALFETTKVAFEVEPPVAGWLVCDAQPGDFIEAGNSFGAITSERSEVSERVRAETVQITAKARALMQLHGISADTLPINVPLVREKDILALVARPEIGAPQTDDANLDTVLLSEEYEHLKQTIDDARSVVKKKFNRHVPIGTLLNDRWELARSWGFGVKASVYDECLILGDVRIAENCWIGPFTVLDGSAGTLEIGDWTSIGTATHIYTHHTIDLALTGGLAKPYCAPTKLGRSCFVAPMAMIAPGTKMGDHCFVAAHSYVEGNFPDYSYIAGNPARVIGKIEIKDGRVMKTLTVATL